MTESEYQNKIIDKVQQLFPGCFILKNDSSYKPGIPDILILFQDRWAMLEIKIRKTAKRQANQDYYVDLLGEMSFAAFIYPDIEEEVLHDLQCAFRPSRKARIS